MLQSNHPDKNTNCDETTKKVLEEEFSKIFTAFKNIVNFILENKDNLEDEEECIATKEFDEVNLVKINKQSMTIYILTVNILQWNEILEEHYGEPNDRSNTGNGKQYKTEDGVSLTVWEKPESKLSTMLISGNKHEYVNFYDSETFKGSDKSK